MSAAARLAVVDPLAEWERCKPFIAAALAYDDDAHSLADLEAMLSSGKLWLYPGERSAGLLELVAFPGWKAINIFLAGGDLKEFKAMAPLLDDVARKAGCKKIIATGRHGFARALADVGFRQTAVFLEKEL